jgi:hypothetical protein
MSIFENTKHKGLALRACSFLATAVVMTTQSAKSHTLFKKKSKYNRYYIDNTYFIVPSIDAVANLSFDSSQVATATIESAWLSDRTVTS